jgi:hypothetical protein
VKKAQFGIRIHKAGSGRFFREEKTGLETGES